MKFWNFFELLAIMLKTFSTPADFAVVLSENLRRRSEDFWTRRDLAYNRWIAAIARGVKRIAATTLLRKQTEMSNQNHL